MPPTDPGSDHPFDTPFSIMQQMQAELVKLREELAWEQQERKAEAQTLRKELSELREAVRKDEEKQKADHMQVSQGLKDLQIKEDKDWKTTRQEMEAELAKRVLVTSFESLSERVIQNSQKHTDASDFLQVKLRELERGIEANAEGDNEFAQHMKKELESQRVQIDHNTLNDEKFASFVMYRMNRAGTILRNAGLLNPEAVQSRQSSVSPAKSPGGAYPRPPLGTTPLKPDLTQPFPGADQPRSATAP